MGGSTSSGNFPLRNALQAGMGANDTGFLVELAPDGTVIYSSYFGGLLGESGVSGVAVDQTGAIYVTGITSSPDFPTTPGLPAGKVEPNGPTPYSGAFITKLNSTASKVVYSALIVGTQVDCSGGSSCFLMERNTGGVAIAVDNAGEAVIAGNTNTTDLPVTPGAVSGWGAFAAKISTGGDQLVYLTYLGPPGGIVSIGPQQTIIAGAIAIDASGDAYLSGATNDSQFPATPGAYQTMLNANVSTENVIPSDAFAIKLSPLGAVVWGTYLGGPGTDGATSVSLDSSGDVWLAGNNQAGFPSGLPGVEAAAGDFLAELSGDGSRLLYTAEFASGTAGQALVVGQSGVLHDAGSTGLISAITPGQPATSRIFGIVNAAAGQVSGRIAPGEVISIFGYGLGPAAGVAATPVNGSFPTSVAGVQVLVNGVAIPLLYVSQSQINAEIPAPLNGITGGDSATMQVMNNSAMLPGFRMSVDPAIFAIFQNADGSLAAVNQDGTNNSASNPAQGGTFVSVWATGFGNAAGTIDGAVTPSANNWCSYCTDSVFEGSTETVQYAGSAPGLIDGVMQINFMAQEQLGTSPYQQYVAFSLGDSGYIWVSR